MYYCSKTAEYIALSFQCSILTKVSLYVLIITVLIEQLQARWKTAEILQ